MIKTIALAGAAAALVLGSIAVAQTTAPNDQNTQNPPAAGDQGAAPADQGTAQSATQNGAPADAAAPNTAGERG